MTRIEPLNARVFHRILSYSKRRRDTSDTIKKFILATNELRQLDLKNRPLVQLFSNWKLNESCILPLKSPVELNPYNFHSRFNEDYSYVSNPRLSVTKLLVDRWCELREYYTIYASSPRYKTTPQLQLGLDLHSKLELELHEFVNIESLLSKIDDIILKKDVSNIILINGNTVESANASEISEKILARLFNLFKTSECREVLAHGFLNTTKHAFIDDPSMLKHNNILISGIIDSLTLTNSENEYDYTLFEEIQHYLEYEYKKVNNVYNVDLSKFIGDLQSILSKYKDNYRLKVTDVKTRSFNKIPHQTSVLQSSKLQTFYYLKFLKILSQEKKNFCYASLAENLQVKGCDIDAPVNLKTMLILLRKHSYIFLQDFLKLSQGQPIGFQPYDEYAQKNYSNYDYDLNTLLDADELKLLSEESFNFDVMHQLLNRWKYPLTLRYFIARASQFYKLLYPFINDLTAIEYHNIKTGYCFQTIEYAYNEHKLDEHIKNSSRFWMGERPPMPADELSKCKYCEFESKCTIPNVIPNNKEIGTKLKKFLHSTS